MIKSKLIALFLIMGLLFSSSVSAAKLPEYRVILDFQYDSISKDPDIYVVSKGSRYGAISNTGKTLIPLQSSLLHRFREGLAQIYKNKKYGFINTSGRTVISPKWDYADGFYEGLAAVCSNYKYGYIDKNGKTVIALQWDFVERFSKDGVACVMMMNKKSKILYGEMLFYKGINGFGKWGLINKTGKVLVSPKYDYMTQMVGNESLIIVSSKNKYGIMDKTGKFAIEPNLNAVTYFSDGYNLSPVNRGGKWAFMDKKGKLATKFEWDEEPTRMEGSSKLWMVAKKDTTPGSYYKFYGAVDDTGKVVIEPVHDQQLYFSDGISKIADRFESSNGYVSYSYGFIDEAGTVICPPKLSETRDFNDGIGWVYGGRDSSDVEKEYDGNVDYEMLRYCWRPIDKTGRYLKLTGWDRVTDFKNGYAAVSNEAGKSTIVDKEFNTVCELDYEVENCLSNNLFIVKKNNKYGVVDRTSKFIYKPDIEYYDFWSRERNGVYFSKSSWSTGTKYSLLGKTDKLLGNTQWDGYGIVQDNMLQIIQKGKFGMIDLSTETVAVTPQFDDMYYKGVEKGESVWIAMKNNKMGVIAIKIPK